ncbi:replication-relaxation family protein [Amorphus orientalis]|uniref:Replication-relaxation n=1 Tax=Amorphus orientalis TaxID=649198 RepID=A0AAE3VPG2_9HYPH|nr:replication-relaxation family protein [Amorphus orientalis]MDQ0316419.1 hypothetical protein [Amorphus orientalis]
MRYKTDTLGRRTFSSHTSKPNRSFKARRRDVEWMQFLNLHGPLSSEYLFQLTYDKAKNRDNFNKQILRLFDGQMIYKPIQQRATDPDTRNGHFHVYDLTEKGKAYLKAEGLWVDAVRPSGNDWVHQFMISSITATIDIMCRRNGYRYIPPHEYLARAGSARIENVPFVFDGVRRERNLTPDAVFAIDYGGGSFIAYALEADRDTECGETADWRRKSFKRSVLQYREVIGRKLYRDAYKREAMMMLLYVTVNPGNAESALRIIGEQIGPCPYIAVGLENAFETPFYPPKLMTHLFEEPLARAGKGAWALKKTT